MKDIAKNISLVAVDIIVLILVLWLIFSQTIYSMRIAILAAAISIVVIAIIHDILTKNKSKRVRKFSTIIFIVMAVMMLLITFVYSFPPMLLFSSLDESTSFKQLESDKNTEKLTIDTPNGKLSGWFYHNADENAPLILYFSGNGESPANRILCLENLETSKSTFEGYNFVCMYYPSYGESEGNPTEENIKQFALNTYDYLLSRDDVDRIVLCGYSVGSGVANYVASERNAAGLILVAAYAEGSDLYNSYVDIFHGPMKLLVSFKMKSYEFAENVDLKPLILQSDSDKIVKYESAERLSKEYKNGCEFVIINGINHNSYWDDTQVLQNIKEYLQNLK